MSPNFAGDSAAQPTNTDFHWIVAMVETRVAPRFRVSKPAQIEHGGDKTFCTVRDLSVTGAALELTGLDAVVPATFTLIVPEDGLKLPCRVVWQRGFRMGVVFD